MLNVGWYIIKYCLMFGNYCSSFTILVYNCPKNVQLYWNCFELLFKLCLKPFFEFDNLLIKF